MTEEKTPFQKWVEEQPELANGKLTRIEWPTEDPPASVMGVCAYGFTTCEPDSEGKLPCEDGEAPTEDEMPF